MHTTGGMTGMKEDSVVQNIGAETREMDSTGTAGTEDSMIWGIWGAV